MVQWTPNVDAMFFKVVLKIHDVKVDYKKAEAALREEGIDVTAKALMHRITKLKATQAEAAENGKASSVKAAKRAADGKPKTIIPDPEDAEAGITEAAEAHDVPEASVSEGHEVKTAAPKKKPRVTVSKPTAKGRKPRASGKGKDKGAKKPKQEDTDEEDMANMSDHGSLDEEI